MDRALVVAALAAVVIGGLVLVLIVVKLVRENARQREAAARPDAWPPVSRERERPAGRQAALMTQEYPAVDTRSVPRRLPGPDPHASPPSGPMRVARAEPPSGPMPYGRPHPVHPEPPSGPQPMPQPEPFSGPQNIPGQSTQKMQTPPPGWRPPVRTTRQATSNGESSGDQ